MQLNSWHVLEFTMNTVTTCVTSYLLFKKLGVDKAKYKYMYLGAAAITIILCILNYIDVDLAIYVAPNFTIYANRLIVTALTLVLAATVFNGSFSEQLMWSFIPMFITSIADFITVPFSAYVGGVDVEAASQYGELRAFAVILYTAIYVSLTLLLANRGKKKPLFIPTHVRYLMVVLVVLGTMSVDILIDNLFFQHDGATTVNFGELFITLSFIALIFLLFSFVFKVGILTSENIAYVIEAKQKQLEIEAFQNMSVAITELRTVKHNMRQHIQVMQGLANDKNFDALQAYFSSFTDDFYDKSSAIITDEPIVNNLLYGKTLMMKQEGIAFDYEIVNLGDIPIPRFDFCSVLGNLLDNAIEASCKLLPPESRYIKLLIKNHRGFLIIDVENNYNGVFQRVHHKFVSSKSEATHGLGLEYVKRIVENNHGHLNISPESTIFIVNVYLPYTQRST